LGEKGVKRGLRLWGAGHPGGWGDRGRKKG